LQLIPIANSMMYILLRALQDGVPETALCGASLGCAPSVERALLLEGLTSIPLMQPGDTVFWHPDVVDAVENEHRGSGYSNFMYREKRGSNQGTYTKDRKEVVGNEGAGKLPCATFIVI
jgi:hypothetical protein